MRRVFIRSDVYDAVNIFDKTKECREENRENKRPFYSS